MLRQWPLPAPRGNDSKEDRGRILVIGGETSLPGAVILSGIAALRAGAGKLQIATCESIAPAVGVAVPESMAVALEETERGTIAPSAAATIAELIRAADAVLIGPGMTVNRDATALARSVLALCSDTPVVIDAGALAVLRDSPDCLYPLKGNAVITPHAGEMAQLLDIGIDEVTGDPESIARDAAATLRAVVVLKGPRTFLAAPSGEMHCYEAGDVGLATSGSGDTLAGVIAGLMARGSPPLHAALWGVFLHGSAGNALAKRVGRIGYLARELLAEIPAIMNGR
ncbi:MAG: NAD(P)H-hydrate dehydratase [Gemmatimonadaceae bacterium]